MQMVETRSDAAELSALQVASELAARYGIASTARLAASVRQAAVDDELSIAVLGRFKAGKSTFLNHFLGRDVLPTGVVPVTAAIAEMRYAPRESARVHYLDGREAEVPLERIGGFLAEQENPANREGVARIAIELPELRRFRGLRFVDTPGIESPLVHNTGATLEWLANVGVALVAVSVEAPLSAGDLALIESLHRHTPRVALLLTKADLLSEAELVEVTAYVAAQLARNVAESPRIFPYSTRPGFERFRAALEQELVDETLRRLKDERHAIVARKLDGLLRECTDYLTLSLKSAEAVDSERSAIRRHIAEEKVHAADVHGAVRLAVRDRAAGSRRIVSDRLETRRGDLERKLLAAFAGEFPRWRKSLAAMLASFESWLAGALAAELASLSAVERSALAAPAADLNRLTFRALEQFRERLSERTERAFGVPLRTAETEIAVGEPESPDIRVARVFDRNWELLSPILPWWAIRGLVRRHFARTVAYLIEQNLSRLAAQWEESINATLWGIEKEVRRRLDELMNTLERLADGAPEQAPQLRADLQRLADARQSIGDGRQC